MRQPPNFMQYKLTARDIGKTEVVMPNGAIVRIHKVEAKDVGKIINYRGGINAILRR
jgi:hydrogenase maturation factor HypE